MTPVFMLNNLLYIPTLKTAIPAANPGIMQTFPLRQACCSLKLKLMCYLKKTRTRRPYCTLESQVKLTA